MLTLTDRGTRTEPVPNNFRPHFFDLSRGPHQFDLLPRDSASRLVFRPP